MILSLMTEHEYSDPGKRDEFNRTTRRLLHSALTGLINAGDERSECIKFSLAEDMNAKRQQRGVGVGGTSDPHLKLYKLEQKIADATKAINDKKKKEVMMTKSSIAAAQRAIESLEKQARELRIERVEKDSAEALEDICNEYGWLGEAALLGLRMIYPERTRAIANIPAHSREIQVAVASEDGELSSFFPVSEVGSRAPGLKFMALHKDGHYWHVSFGDGKLNDEQLELETALAMSLTRDMQNITQPLKEEQHAEVERIWKKYDGSVSRPNGNPPYGYGVLDEAKANDVVTELPIGAQGSLVAILGKDIDRMIPQRWLLDGAVNSYLALLQIRADKRRTLDEIIGSSTNTRAPSHFWGSFFIENLRGCRSAARKTRMERMTKENAMTSK